MSISFKPSLTEVYEYPAFDIPGGAGSTSENGKANGSSTGLKSNSAVGSNLGNKIKTPCRT